MSVILTVASMAAHTEEAEVDSAPPAQESRARQVARQVAVGDKVPDVGLYENNPGEKVYLTDLCHGRRVVVFGGPGAFTPGCSRNNPSAYVARAEELKAKGVDEIVCVAVNDPFVMAAWGREG